MPDAPTPRDRPVHPSVESPNDPAEQPLNPAVPYAELRCATNYSFLHGASHPDELVHRAWRLGYTALAITDINSLAGVVRAYVEAKSHPVKLLIGAEVTLVDGPTLVLWAADRAAYGQLCRLLTTGRRRAVKGSCELRWRDVVRFSKGVLAGVPLRDYLGHPESLKTVVAHFGDRLYGLVELHRGPDDRLLLDRQLKLADSVGITPVASGAVLYHERSRRQLHDVLTATRLKRPVSELVSELQPNGERHLRTTEAIAKLYAEAPELIARTIEVAGRCSFDLSELRYEYPREIAPDGLSLTDYLARETWSGADWRYPDGVPDKVRNQLERELAIIADLKYEAFFLTVYDAVRFAREQGILCQGRGSAANSAVCYCLRITEVDPARSSLLFERFLSKARDEPPDIDVDFEHQRREEVIQYLYGKYGRERAGIAAAVATYRPKSAVRDIGKALGLSLDRINTLSKHVGRWRMEGELSECFEDAGLNPASPIARRITSLLQQLLGFPRHLSQHSGGMVLTNTRLDETVPIENAAMPDRTVVQWDKDDLEALNMLKVDVLALGMLTAVRRCFELVTKHYRPIAKLSDIPAEDRATYRMIQKADTIGVFQIESRAQMSMLPRLRPKCFYDLVIEVAIVRPGPIQGDMVHPYLRRRDGVEAVEYPSKEVKGVLSRTLGVPIFQEQAMELAKVAAGFTADEADQFRRAMAAWRKSGQIDQFERRLKDGLKARGYDDEFADRLFKQIRGFGEYGFPESHAASFALLVYASCWLKCHYPAAFCTALLNSQPMGFYQPAQLIADARKHNVEVHPVDVNHSCWDSTLEPRFERVTKQEMHNQTYNDQCAIRLGFHMVKGFRESDADQIVAARGNQAFISYAEFCRRTRLRSLAVRQLADAGAFGSMNLDRRKSSWVARPIGEQPPLLAETDIQVPDLPHMEDTAEVTADYRATGLSLRGHPLQFLRDELDRMNVTCSRDLSRIPPGRRVSVAGIVLLRQQPGSAQGVVFMTLEDETGTTNLIFWPDVWSRWHRIARAARGLIVTGTLQRERGVIHVIADQVHDLTNLTQSVSNKSRDFR